jgi:putative ABC transport system permease protein
MFRNHIKTAIRNLLSHKGFSTINILGLAIGLSVCLLIIFYVVDELSYDRYNTNYSRILRINTELKFSGSTASVAISPKPLGPQLVKNFPEIENAVRIAPAVGIKFKKGEDRVQEDHGIYSDPSIFDIFTLPMIQGSAARALEAPKTIVLTESMAIKYFNRASVVGETLTIANDNTIYKITGVIKDLPPTSHFACDFIMSLSSLPGYNDIDWTGLNYNTYILLKPGADRKMLGTQIPAFFRKALSANSFNVDQYERTGNYFRISLMPLGDIHLHSNMDRELGVNGDIEYIYIFAAIAVLVMLMACINFMNLSTARSANRAREVGVRKVLGAPRKQLISQFLTESVLVTAASTIIAFLAAWALLSSFSHLADKQLAITWHTAVWLLPLLVAVIVIVGILAGSYPAFYLSAFQPINVLNGKLATGFKSGGLRSFLVVFQFAVSIFLIIGTLVIYNQLHYIQNKDLGFNRSHVLVIKNAGALDDAQVFKQDVKMLPGVQSATLTNFLPTNSNRWPQTITRGQNNSVRTEYWLVDDEYITTMGMNILKGRTFSHQLLTDSSAMIVNETAAKMLGITGDPLNQTVMHDSTRYHIVGVAKDFNFSSLRDNITPVVMVLGHDWTYSLAVRLQTENLPALMAQVESKWRALSPHQQFDYSFMEDDFDGIYRAERRVAKVFVWFTTLAIVIACLGLLGLAAYAAEQRSKEIAVRKVLGAGVSNVVVLLSKDFLKLVFISILISIPISWIVMNNWLQGFAYRQHLQWWVFALASAAALIIAFLTISSQSIKAATNNPAKSLRN